MTFNCCTTVRRRAYAQFLTLLVFLYGMTANLYAGDPLTWSYVTFYPYTYTENGQPKGLVAERVKQLFNHAGISYRAIELPNRRLQKRVLQGQVDFTVVIPSFIQDSEHFLVSELPLASIKLQVYTLSAERNIQRLSDLEGYPLILISGYSYGGRRTLVEHSDKYDVSAEVENHEAGIKALLANRGDYLLGYEKAAQAALELQDSQPVYSYTIENLDVYLYLSKSVPDATHIMAIINESLRELQ